MKQIVVIQIIFPWEKTEVDTGRPIEHALARRLQSTILIEGNQYWERRPNPSDSHVTIVCLTFKQSTTQSYTCHHRPSTIFSQQDDGE
jgi:hypothetical protein